MKAGIDMKNPRTSSLERRLQIERLRLRAELERQQTIHHAEQVRQGLTAQGLWQSVLGDRSSASGMARLVMPAVLIWRRYPYLLGTAGSAVGACFRGRARIVLPLAALGLLAWRAVANRPAPEMLNQDAAVKAPDHPT